MQNISNRSFLLAISFSAALACSSCANENEVVVPWKQVPTAVQKTVTTVQKTVADKAAGQKIGKVEKETTNGTTIYEVKVMNADGSRIMIKVDEDGKLIAVKTKKD